MTKTFKILSAISFIALAIVLTFVGVWALTDLDFTVGGNITYTAPEPEVLDKSQYPMLSFTITDSINKYVEVEAGSTSPTGDIIIPQTVLISGVEYTTTSIANGAGGIKGDGGFGGYTQITSIKMPNSIKTIELWAFANCSGLTNIEIPDSVQSLGNYSFYNCTSLKKVTIGEGMQSIGYGTFYSCTTLAEVIVKAITPPTLDSNVFLTCPALSTIYVPAESLTTYKNADGWKEYNIQPI